MLGAWSGFVRMGGFSGAPNSIRTDASRDDTGRLRSGEVVRYIAQVDVAATDHHCVTSISRRRAFGSDEGASGLLAIFQGLVVLAIIGVLAFDGLSCFINRGLSEDVANRAAGAGGDALGAGAPSLQVAYNGAEAFLQQNNAEYYVIPETVAIDRQQKVVTLTVQREAPTLVFKRIGYTKKWTVITSPGRAGYDLN